MFENAVRKLARVALLGVGATMSCATPSAATTPDRSWIGVKNIAILTRFTSGNVLTPQITPEGLCSQVRAIASRGAPVPVTCVALGDAALTRPDTAVLILDAAITESIAPSAVLVFTVRRESEGGLEPAPIRFGATPRAVPLDRSGGTGKFEAALRETLGQILPWLGNDERTKLKPIRARRT